jgi:hypothetical protein
MSPDEQWVVDYLRNNGGDVLYKDMYNASPFEYRRGLYNTIERLRAGERKWWWNGLNEQTGRVEHRVRLPEGF